MIDLVNLTPHAITLISPDGDQLTIPPSGTVARAATTEVEVDTINVGFNIPLVTEVIGAPVDLPDPQPDTRFIVSRVTVQAALDAGRPVDDLLVPSRFVRDADGNIVGCRALSWC